MPEFDHYDGTLRSLEDSLQRLGVASVDLVLVQDPNRRWHGDAWHERFREVMAGAHRARAPARRGCDRRLRDRRQWSRGVPRVRPCERVRRLHAGGQYTLLDQSAADAFLPYCQPRGLRVLLAAPFNSGIQATGTAADPRYYQPAPPEIAERVGRIEAVCARHEAALPAAALQFPLRHPAITAVLPGLQSADQARSAIAPSSSRRSRPRSAPSLEALGLLHPAAGRGFLSDQEPQRSDPNGGHERGDRLRALSGASSALATLPATLEERMVGALSLTSASGFNSASAVTPVGLAGGRCRRQRPAAAGGCPRRVSRWWL